MPGTITLRVITPDRIVVDTTASEVKFPALDGSMGVLPRHATMVAALDSGALSWTPTDTSGGENGHMVVSGGYKLAVTPKRPAELYHLGTAPGETNNLAGEKPELVEKLRNALRAWARETEAEAIEGDKVEL